VVLFIAAQKIDGMFKGKEHVASHSYPFPLLFDETREVTKAYGVYQSIGVDAYNMAKRSLFVLGGEGRICWVAVSSNQSESPDLQSVLEAIEACDRY